SPPRLLTGAACGGLGSPPARRTRRTYLHHWHSTVHAGDLLHRLTPLSGHTAERRISRALLRPFPSRKVTEPSRAPGVRSRASAGMRPRGTPQAFRRAARYHGISRGGDADD